MLRAELRLLQRFARLYGKRDASKASLFDTDLEAAIQPYHALAIAGEPSAEAEAGEVDSSELERLRAENNRLSDELRITMETMGRMLNEYSTMFAGEAPAGGPAAGAPVAEKPAEAAAAQDAETDAIASAAGTGETAGDDRSEWVPKAVGGEAGAASDDGAQAAVDLVGSEPADHEPGAERATSEADAVVLGGELEDTDPDAADIALMVPEETESATAEAAAVDPAGDRQMAEHDAQTTEAASNPTADDDLSAVADLLAEVEEAGGGVDAQQVDPPVANLETGVPSDAGRPEDALAVSGLNEADDFGDVSVMLEAEDIEELDRDELDGIPKDTAAEDVDEALFDGFDEALTAAEEAADEARVPASQKA
jgi:hypothetical protein